MPYRLPLDVQLSIARMLTVEELVLFCATCKGFNALIAERSVWLHGIHRILNVVPQPQISRRLGTMSTQELKTHVLTSAKLDKQWPREGFAPRRIESFHYAAEIEHVDIVPGGEWLLLVMHDGSLQLRKPGADEPAKTLPRPTTSSGTESVIYLDSRLAVSAEKEELYVVQLGVRYNQCNIYVSRVTPSAGATPALELHGTVSVAGSIWCCTCLGDTLVYGVESDNGDMILHVCDIGPDISPTQAPRAAMNIGQWSASDDFSVTLLSNTQLLLAHHGGLSAYDIPTMPPAPTACGAGAAPTRVDPTWSTDCAIGSGIHRIGPYWLARSPSRPRPVVIAGSDALHLVHPSSPSDDDHTIEYRTIPYPGPNGPAGLGAVGLRRAVWHYTVEGDDDPLVVRLRTYTLPLAAIRDGADSEEDAGGQTGAFAVELVRGEKLLHVCFDDASGRVMLLLNDEGGAKRVALIYPV